MNPLAQGTEKTLSTYIEAAVVVLVGSLVTGHELDLPLLQQLGVALVPAVLTALSAFSGKLSIPETIPRWVQGVLRTVRTTGVAYIGFLIPLLSAPSFTWDRANVWAALAAAATGVLAAAKSTVFGHVGNKQTVAALPKRYDSTPVDSTVAPVALPGGGYVIPPADDPNQYDPAGPTVVGDVPDWAK